MKRIILLLLLTCLLITPVAVIFAQGSNEIVIRKQLLYPGSFYYPAKRLLEKAQEILLFLPGSKLNFERELLATRLSELDNVVSTNNLDEVERSSNRLSYQAGVLTDQLKAVKGDLKPSVISDFMKYQNYLPKLQKKYPVDSAYWMLIQHDIDSLRLYINQLK